MDVDSIPVCDHDFESDSGYSHIHKTPDGIWTFQQLSDCVLCGLQLTYDYEVYSIPDDSLYIQESHPEHPEISFQETRLLPLGRTTTDLSSVFPSLPPWIERALGRDLRYIPIAIQSAYQTPNGSQWESYPFKSLTLYIHNPQNHEDVIRVKSPIILIPDIVTNPRASEITNLGKQPPRNKIWILNLAQKFFINWCQKAPRIMND